MSDLNTLVVVSPFPHTHGCGVEDRVWDENEEKEVVPPSFFITQDTGI